jgi:transaldolase
MAANVGVNYVSFFFNRIRDASPEILKEKLTNQRTNAKKAGESKEEVYKQKLSADCEKMREQRQISEKMLEDNAVTMEDFDPMNVIRNFRKLLDDSGSKTKIIAGSMRSVVDVRDAMLAGAHIVTVPPAYFSGMIDHYKTDEAVAEFLVMFKRWQEQ